MNKDLLNRLSWHLAVDEDIKTGLALYDDNKVSQLQLSLRYAEKVLEFMQENNIAVSGVEEALDNIKSNLKK